GPHGGANEGYVCWIDPSLPTNQQLRYSTYLGGDGGEDGILSVASENSGVITVGGYLSGGFTPRSTPNSLQPTSNAYEYTGFLARLAMDGNGPNDLLYPTYLGDTWTAIQSGALDAGGVAVIVGTSSGPLYPTTGTAWQPAHSGPGLRDAVITHVPLMAGGTSRFGGAFATPACAQSLYHGTFGTPIAGNTAFALSATNAPPAGLGTVAVRVAPLPRPAFGPALGLHALLPTT